MCQVRRSTANTQHNTTRHKKTKARPSKRLFKASTPRPPHHPSSSGQHTPTTPCLTRKKAKERPACQTENNDSTTWKTPRKIPPQPHGQLHGKQRLNHMDNPRRTTLATTKTWLRTDPPFFTPLKRPQGLPAPKQTSTWRTKTRSPPFPARHGHSQHRHTSAGKRGHSPNVTAGTEVKSNTRRQAAHIPYIYLYA